MKFKPFQISDYAAAAMTPGCVLAHDTGLGKSLAAVSVPLLWLDYEWDQLAKHPRVKGSVLIVAPGDLHDQLCAEFKKFLGIAPRPIVDQDDIQRVKINGRIPHGFYITSYTRLAVNGVKKIGDLVKGGTTETAADALHLKLADLQRAYDQRGIKYKDHYATLGVNANSTEKQITEAMEWKVRTIRRETEGRLADQLCAELLRCRDLLINFTAPFEPAMFKDANQKVKFIWRELVSDKMHEYSAGIGETRQCKTGNPACPPEDGQDCPSYPVKCVYSPTVADLCDTLFDCVVIDEGVKMKGTDTAVGKGIRQMQPRFRLVLTATPIKNRLPDVFWLVWWAVGGHDKATARFPYAGGSDELERFAGKFMLSEFNKTKCAQAKSKAPSRYTKLRPEICNIHLLWKIMAPNILRRRKSDIGQGIVKKVRHVYRVPMGLHQRRVYEYHVNAVYLDCNLDPAPGAQLQALRVAAAAPDSKLLLEKPLRKSAPEGLIHRSRHSFTPKVACALALIKDILERREQVAVFSAFNDPSDILSRYLDEAGIEHFLLDGRTSQRKRGRQSAAFNAGECPITLAGIDSMAEGHNWDKVNNIILTSYTWAADKIIQAINRAHRLTSLRDVNIYVVLCDQSADRVLEDNINEKTNSSELAIDGRLLGESTEERSISELLRDALRDFGDAQDCPDEVTLEETWPALREQLREAARLRPAPIIPLTPIAPAAPPPTFDWSIFTLPPAPAPVSSAILPAQPICISSPTSEKVKMHMPVPPKPASGKTVGQPQSAPVSTPMAPPPQPQPQWMPSWRRLRAAA